MSTCTLSTPGWPSSALVMVCAQWAHEMSGTSNTIFDMGLLLLVYILNSLVTLSAAKSLVSCIGAGMLRRAQQSCHSERSEESRLVYRSRDAAPRPTALSL